MYTASDNIHRAICKLSACRKTQKKFPGSFGAEGQSGECVFGYVQELDLILSLAEVLWSKESYK